MSHDGMSLLAAALRPPEVRPLWINAVNSEFRAECLKATLHPWPIDSAGWTVFQSSSLEGTTARGTVSIRNILSTASGEY
jgi:hypothetical protein